MKLIGIVTRKSKTEENHDIDIVYNDIVRIIKKYKAIPIGLILEEDYKELIDICDGIIFQGGDNFEEYDLEALKYAYDIDIPVLGICLGMQSMGVLFGGKMINIENHKTKGTHNIKIKTDTKLYEIFKNDIIKVNSRHRQVIKNTSLKISAISSDGCIEAVEDSNKKFFIGVQWHPESMIDDYLQNKLFKSFIFNCN